MPIIKSAKKRVKVAARARSRNVQTKRAMREALKAFSKALAEGDHSKIAKAEKAAQSTIDIATKKDVIHKNRASRKKAQIAAQAKAKGVKLAAGSRASKTKTSAKTASKKIVSKKPAAAKSSRK